MDLLDLLEDLGISALYARGLLDPNCGWQSGDLVIEGPRDFRSTPLFKINKSQILRSDFLFWTLQNHSINIFGRNYRKKTQSRSNMARKFFAFKLIGRVGNYQPRTTCTGYLPQTTLLKHMFIAMFEPIFSYVSMVQIWLLIRIGMVKKNQQGNAVCLAGCSLVLEHDLPFMVPHVEFSADHL